MQTFCKELELWNLKENHLYSTPQRPINPIQLIVSQTRRASQPSHWFMAILKIKKHSWLKTPGRLSVSHTIGAEMSLIIQIPHIVVIALNRLPYPSNVFISPALFCLCQYIKIVTQGIQNSKYLLPVNNSIWIIFMTQFQHTQPFRHNNQCNLQLSRAF